MFMASSISTSIRPLVKISHHSNVLDQFDQVVQLVNLFAAIFDFIDIIDQYMQPPGFNEFVLHIDCLSHSVSAFQFCYYALLGDTKKADII
ncbi:hypothetical protein BLOT_006685 [Blomia tropicalis]|nr:hypothetical protein BLOT_006685 [Blomia tropicalis]